MGELDQELFDGFVFESEKVLAEDLTGARPKKIIQIYPQNHKWTFRFLASFLNERDQEWEMRDSLRPEVTKELGAHYRTACGISGMPERQNMRINLLPHEEKGKVKIVVDADATWLNSDWTEVRTRELTTHGVAMVAP
jgi:hypothetical protein